MRLLFLPIAICLVTFPLAAQESITQDNNPTGLRWRQVNTPNFRILFPKGFDTQAQRMANTLEHIRESESATMGGPPKKISIVLQNQSANSNGFVTLAPRRSEFFAMPAQNYNLTGNNDWLNLLASHEYRHMVQFQHSITGFNKFVSFIFGQQALAAFDYAAAPQWFWEGDAVATETAFTHSGRGRIPYFDLVFRTNLLEGRVFNYHKQYLRSYKHNIPNHYVLGYHMVSYLRKKTGDPDIWEKISRRAWGLPFVPFTFSNAIKKESGLYVKDLYKEMAADLKGQWSQELERLSFTPGETISQRHSSTYTDYFNPQILDDGRIVAMKSGIGDIEQLVVFSEDGVKKSFVQGPMNQTGILSAAGNKVVWNEYRYDPRWRVKSYSMIMGYDFNTKKKKIVSKNSRYASAALSPDGNKIVTVETGTDYQSKVVLLHYSTGLKIKEFPVDSSDFISVPRWSDDGKAIIALKTNKSGKTLIRLDIESGVVSDLFPFGEENIGNPFPFGKYIFYNSPVSGIDNIYAMDIESKQRYQVTSARYGSYNPVVSRDGKVIFYNNQTKDGMDVVKTPFVPTAWKPLEEIAKSGKGYYQHLVEQEGRSTLLDSIPSKEYAVTNYNRIKGLINPHSWGPYTNTNLSYLDIGIASKDLLSTAVIDLGYRYDATEQSGLWRANASYQGFYPIVDFEFSDGSRSVDEGDLTYGVINGIDTTLVTRNLTFNWKEQKFETGLRVPLLLTRSKYHTEVNVSNFVGVTNAYEFKNSIDGGGRIVPRNFPQFIFRDYLDRGTLLSNHLSFTAARLLKTSRRDIYSKWGQYVAVESFSTPFGGDFSGNLFSFFSRAFFPGLARHHSFNGYWGYQKTEIVQPDLTTRVGLDNYLFRNQIPSPRGQSVARFQDYYSMSANYTFPIWYPDIAIGPLVNLQRVRGNAFIDYAYGLSRTFNRSQAYTSVGGELKFDLNILRFLPQLDLGVRYSYAIETRSGNVEFVIGNIGF